MTKGSVKTGSAKPAYQAVDFAQQFPGLNLPPQFKEDGRPNPDFYRRQLDFLNLKRMEAIQSGGELPAGFEALRKSVEHAAKLAGFSPADLADHRSDDQKIADAMAYLMVDPANRAMELKLAELDSVIAALEREMDKADEYARTVIEAETEEAKRRAQTEKPPWTKEQVAAGKAMAGRLRRVRQLHLRARHPVHEGAANQLHNALEAAWLLRFMVYVQRSNIPERRAQGPAASVIIITRLHARFAVGIWEAEHGVAYLPHPVKGAIPYEGAMLVAPPRHGKTETGAAKTTLRIDLNPYEQCKIGHAVDLEASKVQEYVKSNFDPEYESGRRNLALFPGMQLAKFGNDKNTMRLDLGGVALKDATVSAHGTSAAISGGSATWIWLDDPVDQKEADQETERNRKFDRINGTWLTRRTGVKAFDLTTTTLWHEDDANCRRIKMAAEGTAMIRVVIAGVGGPDSNPPFFALCPELGYDEAFLRRKFNSLRNPQLYACAYQANPSTQHNRKIKRLRFYDAADRDELERFKRTAVFHLSVDPAGTNKQTSDPAGLIYAGQGYVSQEYDENGVRIHRREPQLRILDALEVPSNQVEIVQYMKKYATERPVDQFHVECRSGYTATADMIEAWFGVEVQRHDPGPIKKGVRLQSAAGLIDEGIYDAGGPHAVVLFPGMKLADGTIGPDPQWEWLYDQFLKFGFIKHDHCVDAGTQLINRLAPDLRAGTEGLITRHIIKTSKLNADAELDAEIKRIVAGPVTEIPDEAAADFDVLCLN